MSDELRAAIDEIEKLREINRRACADWAEDDTAIRNQARRVLPEEQCESSDGYHLPIGDVVETMADEIERLRAEVERLKRGDFTEEEFQSLCHNFNADDRCRFCGWMY